MLGKTVMEKEQDERTIFDMAGSGFASTVRLAKSSPEMWTPIFEQNSLNILEVLNEYIANLEEFKKLLENKNWSAMHEQMQEINAIKTILEGIPEGKNNYKN
jgi:prephenate dehydrogenase